MAYIGRNPAIGTQKVLDSLESQFNGVLTTFDLRYNTNTIYPTIASALIVSLGGVLQEPGSAYNVASDQITFATAPPTGTDCWILLYSEFGGVAGATTNLTVGNNLAVQGRVGIGTDSPSELLHLFSGTTAEIKVQTTGTFSPAILELKSPTTSNCRVDFAPDNTNEPSGRILYTHVDDSMRFSTKPSGGNRTERLHITSDGKVRVPDNGKFTAGASDDLQIYHDGTDSRIENSTGDIKLKNTGSYFFFDEDGGETLASFINDGAVNLYYDSNKKFETTSTGATVTGTALATALSTGASGTGINISTNTISGPATLTLDPAAVGDNTGTVIIAGGLQVDGTTTTINSTTLTVDDKNIVLASGAANSAAADGAGITIDGAAATLLYKSTPDAWLFNKNVSIGTDLTGEATDSKLSVEGATAITNLDQTLMVRDSNNDDAVGRGGNIGFGGYVDGNMRTLAAIRGVKENSGNSFDGNLVLYTRRNGQANLDERLRINSAGKILVGSSILRSISGAQSQSHLQIEGISTNSSSLALINNQNAINSAFIRFGKTRGTSTGAVTTVADGDKLGAISFNGADGTDLENDTALIEAVVNGTVSGDTVPTDITFSTSATNGSSKQERLRIDSSGNIGIGTNNPGHPLDVNGILRLRAGNTTTYATALYSRLDSTHCTVLESYLNNNTPFELIGSYADGGGADPRVVISAGGQNVGIGTDNPDTSLEVASSGATGISSKSSNTQTTDTNKALKVRNNSTTDTFNVSYKGQGYFASSVGIGTSTPSSLLHLASNAPYITFEDEDNNQDWQLQATAWFALRNQTTSSELLRVTSNGKVGIGTDSPDAKLHIRGSFNAGGILVEDSSTSTQAPAIKVIGKRSDGNIHHSFSGKLLLARNHTSSKITNNITLGTLGFGGNHTNGTMANILYAASIHGVAENSFDSATDMPTALTFHTGSTGRSGDTNNVTIGSERMRIDSSGRVGIGTDSPGAKLNVVGSANTTFTNTPFVVKLQSTDAPASGLGSGISFTGRWSGTETQIADFGVISGIKENSTSGNYAGALTFGTRANGSGAGSMERMRIDSGGRVGIGTSSPQDLLSVGSTTSIGPRFCIFSPAVSSGDPYGSILFRFNAANGNRNAKISALRGNNSSGADLAFYTRTSSDAVNDDGGEERLRIKENGNVGIGTDNPSGKLQVGSSSASHVIITPNTGIDVNDGAINLYQATSNANAAPFIISSDVGGTETEKLRVTAAGNVGIRQAVPNHLLHIGSTDNSLGGTAGDGLSNFRIESDTVNTDSLNFTTERISTGTTWTTAAQRIQRKVDATLMGYIQFGHHGSGTNTGLITFGGNSSEYARIDGAGKVGIGTDNPSHPLDVRFAGDSGINVVSSNDHSSLFLNAGATKASYIRMTTGGVNKFWIATDTSGHLNFRPNGGGTTVRMQNAGKLEAFQGLYVASSAQLANIELDFTTSNNKFVDFYTANGNTVNFRMPTDANVFHTGIQMTRNGAVSLYHANSVKLYTTSTGVYVDGSYQPTSDVNLKENIITVPDALDKIKAMRGVKFNWKKDGRPDYGVIAQEAETVVPELVADHEIKTLTQAGALKKRPDDSDYVTTTQKGFCYDSMVGILIEAMKEQQATIDSLTARIDALENP